jgi:ubiquinone/menaquinone biosynthesis C-methylase UbiE
MPDLSKLYRFRFREADRAGKMRIWKTLCEHFFQPLIGEDRVIVDLACGYGEFINNIRGKKKYAVDLNPDARRNVAGDVQFCLSRADALSDIHDDSVDVVFVSNFLEHLRTKEECDAVLAEVRRILRPGGRFVIMGPNIRYLAAQYWDFYDHCLPLSHLSLEEGLVQADYEIERVVPRFLPYTTRSRLPQYPALIALYLKAPLAWRLLGKQFLVVGRKPAAPQ